MTRETKIGLLVGLAFIIVVSILLQDHLASTTTPKTASLPDAADSLRASVASPAAEAPAASGPRAPVPTRADLVHPPAADPEQPPVKVGPPAGATAERPAPTGPRGIPPLAPLTGTPGDLVARHPDEFTPVPADGRRSPATKPGAVPPVTAPKTYVAESGDSISRIAQKAMGGNTKANREALVKANASLQGEGAVVYAGRTYVIPSPGATAQAADAARVAPPTAPPAFATPPVAAATATVWYTVRENDNLWRIAQRELGDGNLWLQVRDLNKDILRGGETVKPQTRIRLPKGAATASTN